MNSDAQAKAEATPPATQDRLRQWQNLALLAAAYLALGLVALRVVVGDMPTWLLVVVAVLAGVAFIGIAVGLVACVVRMPLSWRGQLGLTLAFGAGAAGARLAGLMLAGAAARGAVDVVGDLLLVMAAIFFGALVSRVIKERNILVPVAVVAAVVDTWGVYWGLVAEMAKKAPQVVESLTAAVPAATAEVPVPLLGAVGTGDFLFMGLFAAAVWRLGMNWGATLWALFAVLLAVPVVFGALNLPALPGLPFLGLAVVAANWRQFRYTRAEKFALLYGGLILVGLILGAWGAKRTLGG